MTFATKPMPSIRRRLTVWMLSISFLFATLTAGAVWLVLEHEMDEMMNQELREAGELIYHLTADRSFNVLNDPHPPRHSDYEEHLIWQIVNTSDQQVIARSHKAPESPLVSQPHTGVIPIESGQWHATTFSFSRSDSVMLVVAQSDQERREAKSEAVLYALLCAMVSAVCVSLLLNWRIKQELIPLNQLSDRLQQIDPTDLITQWPTAQRAELQPIEAALSTLGHRLSKRLASEQAFAAHAAHALRTPLAGIDAQLAIAAKESNGPVSTRLNQVRTATKRLRYVMQALLSLFRTGMDVQIKTVDLESFIKSLGITRPQIRLTQEVHSMTVDTDLLAAVLFNLLDNSIRHGAEHVDIRLSVQAEHFHLRIQDDGQGCPTEKMQQINRLLQKRDDNSPINVAGLGLVLADLVMRSHHGRVELVPSDSGFTVMLVWPCLQHKPSYPAD